MTSVRAQNFMSHRDTLLEFTEPKMQIAGVNGSGKTSATVDAPLWALFGHARSSTTDGLMGPWAKSMTVALEFEVGVTRYRVSRERGSRSSLTLWNLTDGLDLGEKHIALVQEKIEKLVGSESAFVSTAVFKQGDALRFAQATPSERKSLFDELLGIEAFAEVERRANGKIRALKVEEDRFVTELDRIVDVESRSEVVERQLEVATRARDGFASEETWLSDSLLSAQGVVDGLVSDHANRSEYERDARTVEVSVLRAKQIVTDKILTLGAKTAQIASLESGVCPTCKQSLTPEPALLDPLKEAVALLVIEVRDAQRLVAKLEKDHTEAVRLVETVDRAIETRHDDALKARGAIRGSLISVNARLLQARDEVSRLKGQIALLKGDTSKTEEVRFALREVRQRIGGFGLIAEAFSKRGIPRELTRGFATEVEKAANALLIGLSDMTARISLDKEGKEKGGVVEGTVDVLVTDIAGERKVEMLSGGEKMRVMLAIRLAIQQVMSKRSDKGLRTLILDESLDGLDTAGKDLALTLLTGMTGSFDRMVFITHDSSVAGMFPARIEFAKLTDGSSAVVS